MAVGTTSGFRIYNVYPFQENFRRTFDSSGDENVESNEDDNNNDNLGGIGLAEMLFRCNLLALVGGGPSPRYPPNKVMIWDDHRGRCIGELSFRQRVLSVRLRRDRVAVALMDRIYVYNFSDLTLLDQIHTVNNPLGLLSLSSDIGGLSSPSSVNTSSASMGMVLACPSIARGGVRVELYGCRKTLVSPCLSILNNMSMIRHGNNVFHFLFFVFFFICSLLMHMKLHYLHYHFQ